MKYLMLLLLLSGCAHYDRVFENGEIQPKQGFVQIQTTPGQLGLYYCLLENDKPKCYQAEMLYKSNKFIIK